jgi:hypothetical protein
LEGKTGGVWGVERSHGKEGLFWIDPDFFITITGLMLVQVADPATAEKIVGMLAGIVP